MLRECALQYGKSWDKCLPYVEFSYNNSYQESIKMVSYEFLYDRRCTTPLSRNATGENQVFVPDIIQDAERKVQAIRENLMIAQSRQRSYAYKRRRDLTFEAGDCVFQGVSHEGTMKIQGQGKACTEVHWSFQDSKKEGQSGL